GNPAGRLASVISALRKPDTATGGPGDTKGKTFDGRSFTVPVTRDFLETIGRFPVSQGGGWGRAPDVFEIALFSVTGLLSHASD
ncbi:hypothetical protein H696_06323, partial [Fonticula alba]